MKGPNFFIIGAQKCGTTSLYHYLDQHPDIFMCPIKEPEFFTFGTKSGAHPQLNLLKKKRVEDFEDYLALFNSVKKEKIIGEASPTYLYGPKSYQRISAYAPACKIIALLRNPANRAFSHFHHNLNRGIEPLRDFNSAIKAETDRMKKDWPLYWLYLNNGLYNKHLSNFWRVFPDNNILVIIFEEFIKNKELFLSKICRFLDVDDDFRFKTNLRLAVSGIPKSNLLNWLIIERNSLRPILKKFIPADAGRRVKHYYFKYLLDKPEITSVQIKELYKYFENDISRLEQRLDRNLDLWKPGSFLND